MIFSRMFVSDRKMCVCAEVDIRFRSPRPTTTIKSCSFDHQKITWTDTVLGGTSYQVIELPFNSSFSSKLMTVTSDVIEVNPVYGL